MTEPTAIAALNMNYPGSKLTIHILDDGKIPDVEKMVKRLDFQCQYMQREATIVYVARDKVKGIPHHAKAGNINNAILKQGPGQGEYILVLDCDMIVHPDFLMRSLGHFYQEVAEDYWVPKEKAAFLQTPQVHTWHKERLCSAVCLHHKQKHALRWQVQFIALIFVVQRCVAPETLITMQGMLQ